MAIPSNMPIIHKIPEQVVEGKRLGRHLPNPVTRAAGRMEFGAPQLASELKPVRHVASSNMPLNQGDTSGCTAHAEIGVLNCVPHWPNTPNNYLTQGDVWSLYSAEEQALFGTGYPPTDEGGTGQAVSKAAIAAGWSNRFNVAEGIQECLLALVIRPVITGVNWYSSFDTPDSNGLVSIQPGAYVRGGHEFMLDQIVVQSGVSIANMMNNLDNIQVWGYNSWGPTWGQQGRFGMTATTWQTLLHQAGDCDVPRTAIGWTPPASGA